MLLKLLTTILIFTSLIKTEPSGDLIKETREKIAQINVSLLENSLPNNSFVNELDKFLNELKGKYILTGSIVDEKDYKMKSHQLIKSFKAFERFCQNKPEIYTIKKVFRVVNNEFNSLFGNYFLDELEKSSKKKIIVFSTSMSCECTLELCYKNEADVQRLRKENPGLFEYAVVDCYTSFDLQTKYKAGFIPVVVVLDSNNDEVKRFVRSESLYEELKNIMKDN